MSTSLQQPVRPVDADVAAAHPARPRAALAVAMFGFAVVTLDAQVVNMALPAIRAGLAGGLSGL